MSKFELPRHYDTLTPEQRYSFHVGVVKDALDTSFEIEAVEKQYHPMVWAFRQISPIMFDAFAPIQNGVNTWKLVSQNLILGDLPYGTLVAADQTPNKAAAMAFYVEAKFFLHLSTTPDYVARIEKAKVEKRIIDDRDLPAQVVLRIALLHRIVTEIFDHERTQAERDQSFKDLDTIAMAFDDPQYQAKTGKYSKVACLAFRHRIRRAESINAPRPDLSLIPQRWVEIVL